MNWYSRYLPWVVVMLGASYLVTAMMAPADPEQGMHLEEFGKIPVIDHGRIKPLDTLARNSLMIISSRQAFRDEAGNEQPVSKWLLDVMTSDQGSEGRKVFRVEDEQLRGKLGLPAAPAGLYSVQDLGKKTAAALFQLGLQTEPQDEKEPDPLKAKVIDLARQMVLYVKYGRYSSPHKVFRIDNDQVLNLLGLEGRSGFRYAFPEFSAKLPQLIDQATRAQKVDDKERDAYAVKVLELVKHVELYIGLARLDADTLKVIPPQSSEQEWKTYNEALEIRDKGVEYPAAQSFDALLAAYGEGNVQAFNRELASYHERLDTQLGGKTGVAGFEVFFNHLAPFYQCAVLYVVVFLLACLAWLGWTRPLNQAAFWLAMLTLTLHTWGLAARMYIQGRPPVTNLYSSAVFVGWGCVIAGLTLEAIFRNGIGNVVAAVLGFLTMLLAHHMAGGGDTLEMLQAVLDTNFWLATHVTCVTIGYTATLVAGLLGMLFILLGVFTPALDRDMFKVLGQMIYGIVCFATLFSFTGTVLGGIWADQSWGRFWGWDPKENGALLIVLMNALVLHARWGGIVKQRGMAVLTVVGNMVVGWSWLGTNQLGVGLHAYGFNSTLAKVLVIGWAIHLAVILTGWLVPAKHWRSFGRSQSASAYA